MFLIIMAVCLLIGGFPLLSDPEYVDNGRFCVALGFLLILYRLLVYWQPFARIPKKRNAPEVHDVHPEPATLTLSTPKIEQPRSSVSFTPLSKNAQIESLLSQNASLKSEVSTLKATCSAYNLELAQILCELSKKDDIITTLKQELNDQNNLSFQASAEELSSLKFQLEYSELRIAKLNATIANQQEIIDKLKRRLLDLEDKNKTDCAQLYDA